MRKNDRSLSKSQLIQLIKLRQLQIAALGEAIKAKGFAIKILPNGLYELVEPQKETPSEANSPAA